MSLEELRKKQAALRNNDLESDIEELKQKVNLTECLSKKDIEIMKRFLKGRGGLSFKDKETETAGQALSLLHKAEDKFYADMDNFREGISEAKKWRRWIYKTLEGDDFDEAQEY